MDIKAEVKRIVVEQLAVPAASVVESASFIDDLDADSLAIVELVLAFEEHFGVTIPEDAANAIATVGDATAFIEELFAEKARQHAGAAELRP